MTEHSPKTQLEAIQRWTETPAPYPTNLIRFNIPGFSYGDNWMCGYEAAQRDILELLNESEKTKSVLRSEGERKQSPQRRFLQTMRKMNPDAVLTARLDEMERQLDAEQAASDDKTGA